MTGGPKNVCGGQRSLLKTAAGKQIGVLPEKKIRNLEKMWSFILKTG